MPICCSSCCNWNRSVGCLVALLVRCDLLVGLLPMMAAKPCPLCLAKANAWQSCESMLRSGWWKRTSTATLSHRKIYQDRLFQSCFLLFRVLVLGSCWLQPLFLLMRPGLADWHLSVWFFFKSCAEHVRLDHSASQYSLLNNLLDPPESSDCPPSYIFNHYVSGT